MRLNPFIAAVVVALLAACLFSAAWRLLSASGDSSLPGVAIWMASIAFGTWEYRRRVRKEQ